MMDKLKMKICTLEEVSLKTRSYLRQLTSAALSRQCAMGLPCFKDRGSDAEVRLQNVR